MKKALFALPVLSLLLVATLVSAAPAEKTEAFVCPVIIPDAVGDHNPNAVGIGEGHYTVLPGARGGHDSSISVPGHATNGDGAGTPPGPHSEPGDTDYTAIWAVQ